MAARCRECGWKLPIAGARYRNSGAIGFDCPECSARLSWSAGIPWTPSLTFILPILGLVLLYNVPDWAKVAIVVALIPFFFITLAIEKLELIAPAQAREPDLPKSESATPPPD